jgi:hypothetical protein
VRPGGPTAMEDLLRIVQKGCDPCNLLWLA